ncbi:hypothetical protein AVEN_130349-1 [Araneus ventricosus]|uniref:DUF5641 domain-containing protein n=1 Tax=Araneus ventricosus TaxID=182803 RepID=A0A4Y2BFS8_ARAVE|nr:hypothetical protein AVEN_130349-1 [Araneus ventricosus]
MLVHKGHSRKESLSVGDVVLLETDGKCIIWPLGIIIQILPGADGYSRVAKERTTHGKKVTIISFFEKESWSRDFILWKSVVLKSYHSLLSKRMKAHCLCVL